MTIQALGYVGVRAKSLEDWAGFGEKFLGLQLVDKSRAEPRLPHGRPQAARRGHARTAAKASRFFGWEVADAAALDAYAARLEQAGVAVVARHARARRRAARRRPDRVRRSGRQPARNLPRRRDRERAVQARPQHLRLPHRPARHGPRGAARQKHQRRDPVLSRRARLPALRLHDAAVQRLFLPRQSAPPLDRLHRDRPQRHASSDDASSSISTTSASATTSRSARKAASASRSAATSTTR